MEISNHIMILSATVPLGTVACTIPAEGTSHPVLQSSSFPVFQFSSLLVFQIQFQLESESGDPFWRIHS